MAFASTHRGMRGLIVMALLLAGAAVASSRLRPSRSDSGLSAPTLSRIGGQSDGLGGPVAPPFVGEALSTSNGSWSKVVSGYAYRWQDCDSNGQDCATAAGSPTNAHAYTVVEGDIGHTIKVVVAAAFTSGGQATEASLPTSVVRSLRKPVNTSRPTISGIPMPATSGLEGAGALTVTTGTWTNRPGSYSYQWQDCDAAGANCRSARGAGAARSRYTVAPADTGSSIRVKVTAYNSVGPSAAVIAHTGPAPALWYEGQKTGSAKRDASLFRMINLNLPSARYVDAVHAVNRKTIVLGYTSGISSNPSQGSGDPCSDSVATGGRAVAHSGDPRYDWFLYNRLGPGLGNRVEFGANNYVMDVRNKYWEHDCGAYNVKRAASAWHLRTGDGIFVDDLSLAMSNEFSYPFTAATGDYRSDASWDSALVREMMALGTSYHGAGYIEIPNVSYGCLGRAYAIARQAVARAADGSMEEGFPWPNVAQDRQWVCKVNEGVYDEAHGKWFIAVTDSNTTSEAGLTYGLASFLMEANGHSVYSLGGLPGSRLTTWYPELNTAMELGPALGTYHTRTVGGYVIYERAFSNGVALVNPSQNSIPPFTPEAGGHLYSGSGYVKASRVTLRADQGLVLLRTG